MADVIRSVGHLEEMLSQPTPGVVGMMHRLRGDVLVLGAGGKMGPSLARMARRAADRAPFARRVIAVSRFTDQRARQALDAAGVETIAGDLLEPRLLQQLPDAENIIYMPAMKFGAAQDAPRTWAINAHLPGLICRRFPQSRIAAFSTGNVYGMKRVREGGSKETDPLHPEGEYAYSCVGRERIFEHFSRQLHTPVAIVRLNYACEMRYGVLLDVAKQVLDDKAVNLKMGHFNAIWQADATAMALQALEHASTPPFVINVAGPEILNVQTVAQRFGQLLDRTLHFIGEEAPDAFISDPSRAVRLFGEPAVSPWQMMRWIADWIHDNRETYDRPTHFQVRDGVF